MEELDPTLQSVEAEREKEEADPYEGIPEAVLDGPGFVDDPEQELPDSTPADDSGEVGDPVDDVEN